MMNNKKKKLTRIDIDLYVGCVDPEQDGARGGRDIQAAGGEGGGARV